jgi:hypothetical protein
MFQLRAKHPPQYYAQIPQTITPHLNLINHFRSERLSTKYSIGNKSHLFYLSKDARRGLFLIREEGEANL